MFFYWKLAQAPCKTFGSILPIFCTQDTWRLSYYLLLAPTKSPILPLINHNSQNKVFKRITIIFITQKF